MMKSISIGTILFLLAGSLQASLQLASPFTDHMVLQRNQSVPVWGWAEANAQVNIQFAGQNKVVTSDSSGSWRVDLEPLATNANGEEFKVSIKGSDEQIVLTDVLVGEVWICSGQSNMKMELSAVPEIKALVREDANIRSFQVQRTVAFAEQVRCEGEWLDSYPNSAVAAAFAHCLNTSTDVPVGIILTAWGSSSIEAWMPRDMTEELPYFKIVMDEFDSDYDAIERIQGILDGPRPWSNKDDVFLRRQSNILYNAMMNPLVPFACNGIVWYQGERNTKSMEGMLKEPWFARTSGMLQYGEVLKHWIKRYRKEWGGEDFQFLIVMLPGFGKVINSDAEDAALNPDVHSWAWMRESQLKALDLPNVAVANTIDLGELKDIHPKDKLPIGERLALLAEKDTLNHDIEVQGPVMKKVKRSWGRLVVSFDHANGLKTTDGSPPSGFWLADEDEKWVRADARIKGEKVLLTTSEIKKPLYVRYAFAGKPDVNLVNAAGLPAYPFRTDQFLP